MQAGWKRPVVCWIASWFPCKGNGSRVLQAVSEKNRLAGKELLNRCWRHECCLAWLTSPGGLPCSKTTTPPNSLISIQYPTSSIGPRGYTREWTYLGWRKSGCTGFSGPSCGLFWYLDPWSPSNMLIARSWIIEATRSSKLCLKSLQGDFVAERLNFSADYVKTSG